MFDRGRDTDDWTAKHQELHSLLWCTFLNVGTPYDSRKFRDRYQLWHGSSAYRELEARAASRQVPRLRTAFFKLATWMAVPSYYGRRGEDEDGFRANFRQLFGFELAAVPGKEFDRPFLPALPEIGIEGASLHIETMRPAVRARMEAVVLVPFRALREFVCPWNWSSCAFWGDLPPRQKLPSGGYRESLRLKVRLPGGRLVAGKKTKERPVQLQVDIAASPFEARIDYAGRETETPGSTLMEIGDLGGFLLIEKLAGRPNACRVVAQREVRFLDFNHYVFGAETTAYWLASELVAFAEDAGGLPA